MAMANNLSSGVRARRKQLITVAAWGTVTSGTEEHREILGIRTEDSSIELNPDTETTTDILGNNYTDVNKTELQQDFDPFFVIGGSALVDLLNEAILSNNPDAYTNCFTIYVITAYISETTTGQTPETYYRAVKHENCSIIPTSLGGDSYVSMPVEVHFSNKLTMGKVDGLTSEFGFTADT